MRKYQIRIETSQPWLTSSLSWPLPVAKKEAERVCASGTRLGSVRYLSVISSSGLCTHSRCCRLIGSDDQAGTWGHEYVRNLAGEISAEFQHREEQDEDVKDLLNLVSQIVPYHMSHNAEPDAVDLLLEVEKLEWLAQYVDDKNYSRTCLYLVSCCAYLAEPDDTAVLRTAYDLYIKCSKYVDAMRIALRMNNHELILSTMTSCPDNLHKKQLAFLLARHGVLLMYEEEEEDAMEDASQVRAASRLASCQQHSS